MTRVDRTIAAAAGAVALQAAPDAAEAARADAACRVVEAPREGSGRKSGRTSASAFASASTRGGAVSVSRTTDENGRTVTVTRDRKGCRVVVDDPAAKGERR